MNLVADEGVDGPIVYRLREEGHSVIWIAEVARGSADDTVLDLANTRRALLLTSDKDFGELVYRQRLVTAGVVLLRLAGLSSEHKAEIVATVLRQRERELSRAFTVIAPGSIRIRRVES